MTIQERVLDAAQGQLADTGIPRIIWFMWWQGLHDAPYVVRQCYSSWKRHNPGWQVVFLDQNNLEAYINIHNVVDIGRPDISIQKAANIVRINLLRIHGGVWADATCFCSAPLDDWLGGYAKSGFFAFVDPGEDRLLSNWFLASASNEYLISKFCDAHNEYWNNNKFSRQDTRSGQFILKWLSSRLNRNPRATGFWFSAITRKILRVYPYFVFHYHFAKLVREDRLFGRSWERMERYPADIPQKVRRSGLFKPISPETKAFIDAGVSPLHKLTWKFNREEVSDGCTLDYLLRSGSSSDS